MFIFQTTPSMPENISKEFQGTIWLDKLLRVRVSNPHPILLQQRENLFICNAVHVVYDDELFPIHYDIRNTPSWSLLICQKDVWTFGIFMLMNSHISCDSVGYLQHCPTIHIKYRVKCIWHIGHGWHNRQIEPYSPLCIFYCEIPFNIIQPQRIPFGGHLFQKNCLCEEFRLNAQFLRFLICIQ